MTDSQATTGSKSAHSRDQQSPRRPPPTTGLSDVAGLIADILHDDDTSNPSGYSTRREASVPPVPENTFGGPSDDMDSTSSAGGKTRLRTNILNKRQALPRRNSDTYPHPSRHIDASTAVQSEIERLIAQTEQLDIERGSADLGKLGACPAVSKAPTDNGNQSKWQREAAEWQTHLEKIFGPNATKDNYGSNAPVSESHPNSN